MAQVQARSTMPPANGVAKPDSDSRPFRAIRYVAAAAAAALVLASDVLEPTMRPKDGQR
jgi:hypothetical protein